MVNQIYPPEQQLNKAYASETIAPFWIYNYLFQTVFFPFKSYDKHDDFDFNIVNFPFQVWKVMFPVVPFMGYTFHNLLGLLECTVTGQVQR